MNNFFNLLNDNFNIDLNPQQKSAVSHKDGPAVILAVPGAGKTTVLICRTANLIMNHNINPKNILSITFSKASARDMNNRFSDIFGNTINKRVKFSTIHSFAFMLIKEYAYLNNITYKLIEGIKGKFNKTHILKGIYRKFNNNYINDDKLEELLNSIGFVKNMMIDISNFKDYDNFNIKNFDKIFKLYENYKRENNLIDFDDMLTMTLDILRNTPGLLKKYQNRYKYIQLDEGQDTSKIQNKIVQTLVNPKNNLFVVADDDQSIYGFRGASPKDLLNFKHTYKDAKTFFMEENFRSTKNIVSVCNDFIKSNTTRYNKNIFTNNDSKGPINIIKLKDEFKQYEYIINKLAKDTNFSDTAILFRNNISAITLAEVLNRNNIPFYNRDSKLSFFNHWIVHDIKSFIRLTLDNSDTTSFEHIYFKMKGYLSKASLNYIQNRDRNTSVFDRLMDYPGFKPFQRNNISNLKRDFHKLSKKRPYHGILFIEDNLEYKKHLLDKCEKFNYSYDNIKNILSTLKTIALETTSFIEFLNRLDNLKSIMLNSKDNFNKNAISLSTIHSAKGLEFNNVFIIDLIDGDFPSSSSIENYNIGDISDLEEERRLFYVAMTRAKENLDLITVKEKNRDRVSQSRFISEIETIVNEDNNVISGGFKVGDSVNHKKFGFGKINGIYDNTVVIIFDNNGKKELSLDICIENNLLKVI
ncbi:ATP-dependent helicase [Dethiothermospora halolimnae]|uniref:ATP-dependent helicase n=1 Tax=Dethiothermospora halolimnae TaxID=3114390 RepID=UPI003CCBE601